MSGYAHLPTIRTSKHWISVRLWLVLSRLYPTSIHESHVDLFQHAQDLGGPGVECAQPQDHPWRSRCEPMKPQGVQSGEVDTSKARGCGNASRVTINSGHLEARREPKIFDRDLLGCLACETVDGEHALQVGGAG